MKLADAFTFRLWMTLDASQVVAHHFCSHVSGDMRQCIIYDSNKSDAKLIGIEYIISRKLFETLPAEERKYWHSHEFEVRLDL